MKIETLGDPHLGKTFKTGVPLHRVGEREKLVLDQFEKEILTTSADIHICMGDLFDKPVVSPDIILFAADVYARAPKTTTFYIMKGNHDGTRNRDQKSSFDVFKAIVEPLENVIVVDQPLFIPDAEIGLCPYNFFGTADDFFEEMTDQGLPKAVYGHWDVAFGEDNLIPAALMKELHIETAYTGHDHLARVEKMLGVTINLTGSMQPYTHAEDAKGDWYVTVELDELLERQDQFLNKNVRVLLKEGEILPTEIDCLSMIGKRISTDESIEVDTSDFDSFDIETALANAIPGSIRDRVMEVFRENRS